MGSLARWCFRHRYIVIILWLVALGGSYYAAQTIGSNYSDSFSLPNTDSTRATDLLKTVQTGASGETDTIVWHVNSGSVKDRDVRNTMSSMLQNVAATPEVSSVRSPYTKLGVMQISKDGKTAYAQIGFSKDPQAIDKADVQKVISLAEGARSDNLQVEIGGQAIESTERTPPSRSGAVGVVAAAVVLFIAFGSLLGMSVPLITALLALEIGLNAISLLSHPLAISSFSPTLAALIGLGVGIDYALFIITRHTAGLRAGLSPEEAAVKALDTAGRAVLFAGTAVCAALLGLLILQINFLNGVGTASAAMVAVTVLAAVTLLPALLGVFKMKILSRRSRKKLEAEGPVTEENVRGVWSRNAEFVQKRPWAVAVAALAIMAVLIIPYFSLRIGSSDASNDPVTDTTHQAYTLLADGFGPGFNGPLLLVSKVDSASDRLAFANLAKTLMTTPGVDQVQPFPLTPTSQVGVIQVVPTTSPESVDTNDLIKNLRQNIVPAAEQGTDLHVYVGGVTAIFSDFSDVIAGKLPLFLGVIIGFECLILMVAFRSLVVPLTAAFMNILAAGAAFGVVVVVFQWGWGANLLHTGGPGPVEAFLPVMMLAILFGLSMDYQVFLVSRMHEEWVHSHDNHRAVRLGQAETGRVITAAATIMILVFGSFVFGGQRVIEEFGVGLASAVLLDAFVLRNFLVPALMHIFGRSNWWLPRWLDFILPHLAVEPMEPQPVHVGVPVAVPAAVAQSHPKPLPRRRLMSDISPPRPPRR